MWPRAWNINKCGVKQHRDRMHPLGEKSMKPKTIKTKYKLGKGIGVVAVKQNATCLFVFTFQACFLTLNGQSYFENGAHFSFELLNTLVHPGTPVRLSSS